MSRTPTLFGDVLVCVGLFIAGLALAILLATYVGLMLFGPDLFTTREAGQGPTTSSPHQPGVRAPRGSTFPNDRTVSGLKLSADCRLTIAAPGHRSPVKQYGGDWTPPTLSADSKFILPTTREHARPAPHAAAWVASAAAGMGVSPAADLS